MKIKLRHILVLLLIIILSRIAWYDIRAISSRFGEESNIQTLFLLQAIISTPIFFLFFLIPNKKGFKDSLLIPIFGALILHTIVTGVVMGNSKILIVQEIYKYALIPITFILTASLSEIHNPIKLIKDAALIVASMMILRVFIFIILSGGSIFIYGTPQDLFAICFFLGMAIHQYFAKMMSYSIGCFGIHALGEKRTVIILAALSFFLFAVEALRGGRKVLSVMLMAPIAALAILSLVQYSSSIGENRLQSIAIKAEFSEERRRVAEIQAVSEKFSGAGVVTLVLGFGGGAVIDLPSYINTKTFEGIHSLHNTPATLIYRHGILGVIVYLYLIFAGTGWLVRNVRSGRHHLMSWVLLTYKICAVIASMIIFGLVDDILIGLSLGLIARQRRLDAIARPSPNNGVH